MTPIAQFEKDSKILEAIAAKYPKKSKEYAAVERAAMALFWASFDRPEEFKAYVREARKRYDAWRKGDTRRNEK